MLTPYFFTSVIDAYLPQPHAALLKGIIFGISLKTTPVFYQQIKMVGLLHIVVLSGINITLLSALTLSLTLFLGRRISILITILMVILFIIFVKPQAPVIRAGIMSILTFVAIIYKRKTLALYLLFISGLLTLILIPLINLWYPKWFSWLSFLLSYGATLGIILFGQTKKSQGLNFLNEVKISLAAQIFTAPIIFVYFKQISLISPLANLLVSPLIGPLMVFGFLTAILGKIDYTLGFIPSLICYALLSYLIYVIQIFSKLPFIFFQF